MLVLCPSAIADPKLVVCDRPNSEEKGCGPNNAFWTYSFLVETDDFDKESPEYEFQERSSCSGTPLGEKYRYPYEVTPTTISFTYAALPDSSGDKMFGKFDLDRETLTAVLSNASRNANLVCRIEEVNLKNKL